MPAAAPATRPDYGIDAPNVMRNFFLAAFALLLAALFLPAGLHFHISAVQFNFPRNMFLIAGLIFLAEGFLYLLYVKRGKFGHRDRILSLYRWRGDEHVLDVGTGRGLLLAGAAKRLTTGRATGIDIWSTVDMGGNSISATRNNLALEGLTDRCELITVPAQEMAFPDASFDVVVSNLCIHNIPTRAGRDQACRQIVRVLRPGGVALISDWIHTGQYAAAFRAVGCTVTKHYSSILSTFPPLPILHIRKPL